MNRNFDIVDGIYLVQANHELDLHNNFDFKNLDYSVEKRKLVLNWQRSEGDWVSSDTPKASCSSPAALIQAESVQIRDKNIHEKPHILFVCGKNKWRSPTAERIYRADERIEVRSAEMSGKSKHTISNNVVWADLILVMESGYRSWILGLFGGFTLPNIESLDIPDEYEYIDDDLIELIENGVEYHIEKLERQMSL